MKKGMKKGDKVDLMKTPVKRSWRRVNMIQLKKLNKTKHHCGNMLIGLKQGKGLEPLNFIAPITTIITQVHTPVPESISAGKGHGMEIKNRNQNLFRCVSSR